MNLSCPITKKNGSQYHKQINVLWGDDDHHTICLVRCDVTDIITAEQKSREILQNTLKLAQEANQAKSDFLSSMSHDIRTPMNAIIGMTDLALENVGTQMPTSEYLQIIKSSSMHLLTLINDILDMSRIRKRQADNRTPPLQSGTGNRPFLQPQSGADEQKTAAVQTQH